MQFVPPAELYDKRTGRVKFKYRIRFFAENHPGHLYLAFCLILFTAVLFGSMVMGLSSDVAPFLASFVMMAAMFFGAFHIKMSQSGNRRKRYKPDTLTDQEVKDRMEKKNKWSTGDWKPEDVDGT